MENKNPTYEDLRAKPGYGTYGFTNWVDNVIGNDPRKREKYILPIHGRLKPSSSTPKRIIHLVERQLKECGEIARSFHYKPTDCAVYLIRTLDHYHEIIFSPFEKYFFGKNINHPSGFQFKKGECILKPHIFLRHPKVEKAEEKCLDRLIFEYLAGHKSFGFNINPNESYLEASLFGTEEDKEVISETISLIPYYERVIRDPYNLALSEKIIKLRRERELKEDGFDEELKKSYKNEAILKNCLRKD